MEQHHVEHFAARTVDSIDELMRLGAIPRDALTYEDVCKHATQPVGDLARFGEIDRGHVISRVDEVLRIRAGGVY